MMKLPRFRFPKFLTGKRKTSDFSTENINPIYRPLNSVDKVRSIWRRMSKHFRLPRWVRNPYNIALVILLLIIGASGLAWFNQRGNTFGITTKLSSPSFINGGTLPAQFTCDGDNLSPEFEINNIPNDTKSLAFIIEDQDLDKKQFKDLPSPAHLMVWNIPANTKKFTQGIRPPGTIGRNLFGNFAYGGPCPPEGETHKYSFTLYFIKKDTLTITSDAGLVEAKKTIEKNSIGRSKLTASYSRVKK